jgi:hypothetical protein
MIDGDTVVIAENSLAPAARATGFERRETSNL